MTVLPVARFLIEVGGGAAGDRRAAARVSPRRSDTDASDTSKIEAAYARGLTEGRAELAAAVAAAIDGERQEAANRVAEERAAWVAEEAQRMAQAIATSLRALEDSIGRSAALILKPFLAAALVARAQAELVEFVRGLATRQPSARIVLEGPADLVDALQRQLGRYEIDAECRPAPVCDVRITVDHAIVESTLSLWMAQLEEAVG